MLFEFLGILLLFYVIIDLNANLKITIISQKFTSYLPQLLRIANKFEKNYNNKCGMNLLNSESVKLYEKIVIFYTVLFHFYSINFVTFAYANKYFKARGNDPNVMSN